VAVEGDAVVAFIRMQPWRNRSTFAHPWLGRHVLIGLSPQPNMRFWALWIAVCAAVFLAHCSGEQ